jgi:hypothetical protein
MGIVIPRVMVLGRRRVLKIAWLEQAQCLIFSRIS